MEWKMKTFWKSLKFPKIVHGETKTKDWSRVYCKTWNRRQDKWDKRSTNGVDLAKKKAGAEKATCEASEEEYQDVSE